MALFHESSFEEDKENTVHILSPERSQPPASPAPGDPRPASTAGSSRYHPSTPIEDRLQEDEDSTEDEKPFMDPEELARIAGRILKTTPSVSEVDEPVAGTSRPRERSPVRYSSQGISTYIHGHASFMAPQVPVRCPPFFPCPPFRPSSPLPLDGLVVLLHLTLRLPLPLLLGL